MPTDLATVSAPSRRAEDRVFQPSALARSIGVGLAAVMLLALALRLYALRWGLPDVHHPDELYILNRALAFAKGDLNPHNFLYPTLYFYALFAWEGLFFVLGRAIGLYGSLAAFEREFFADPSHVVIAGRALTATSGVATVLVVYRFGARLFDRQTGLAAAMLLAVAPFAVRDAHYIKLDVPTTLFIVLTQAAVARLVADPAAAAQRRAWILAGAMAGLALSTQYYAFPVILSIVAAAAIVAWRTSGWRKPLIWLVWAGAASAVAFIAASPFFFLELDTVARDMAAVRQINVDRALSGAGAFGSLGAYLRMTATEALGWTTALAAAMGIVVVFAKDVPRAIVLACFPLAYFAFLANTVPMSRYVNPMLPSLAVAAAFGLKNLALLAPKHRRSLLLAVLTLAVSVQGLAGSLRADAFYAQPDTRTLARLFLERTAESGSTVLVQPHSVQLRPSRESLVEALRAHLGSESAASIKFQKQLVAAGGERPRYRVLYIGTITDGGFDPDKLYVSPSAFSGDVGLHPLRAQRVAYVALNRYNTGNSAFRSLDAALHREAYLLATFSPYRDDVGPDRRAAVVPFFHNTADRIDPALERPGPIVEVWRID